MQKRRYEFTREIFNSCSNNQMRDIFFDELELDDAAIDSLIDSHLTGNVNECDRYTDEDGIINADIVVDGLRQKLTFCEI